MYIYIYMIYTYTYYIIHIHICIPQEKYVVFVFPEGSPPTVQVQPSRPCHGSDGRGRASPHSFATNRRTPRGHRRVSSWAGVLSFCNFTTSRRNKEVICIWTWYINIPYRWYTIDIRTYHIYDMRLLYMYIWSQRVDPKQWRHAVIVLQSLQCNLCNAICSFLTLVFASRVLENLIKPVLFAIFCWECWRTIGFPWFLHPECSKTL